MKSDGSFYRRFFIFREDTIKCGATPGKTGINGSLVIQLFLYFCQQGVELENRFFKVVADVIFPGSQW